LSFPVLAKAIGKADLVVFFDFEATQFSHLPIALGIVAFPKKEGEVFPTGKKLFTYKTFIQTPDKIGPVVEEMTGITKSRLSKEGKPLGTVIKEVIDLTRPYALKAYVSYGSMDIKILSSLLKDNVSFERDFYTHVTKHYFDFHNYLSHLIVNEKGQSYSLEKLCEIYGVKNTGKAHDPLCDARALALLFLAYPKAEKKTLALVEKNYSVNPYNGKMNAALAKKVLEDGKASQKDLEAIIEANL
jgi:DNA polymerase III epsilon subunit-like protein